MTLALIKSKLALVDAIISIAHLTSAVVLVCFPLAFVVALTLLTEGETTPTVLQIILYMTGVYAAVLQPDRPSLYLFAFVPLLILSLRANDVLHFPCTVSQAVFELSCVHFAIHVEHLALAGHSVVRVAALVQLIVAIVDRSTFAVLFALFVLSTVDCHWRCVLVCGLTFDDT